MRIIDLKQHDIKFQEFVTRVHGISLISPDRLYTIYQLAKCYPNGNAAELGVYKGGSALVLASLMKGKIDLFDTFSGMPESSDIDIHQEGDFADTSLKRVQAFLKGLEHVEYYPGFFPDTAPKSIDYDYSLVHIDSDIYQSTLDALEYFYPKTIGGGVIIFDDYGWENCPGVDKAVNEFFSDKPEKPVYLGQGQAIVIKQKSGNSI